MDALPTIPSVSRRDLPTVAMHTMQLLRGASCAIRDLLVAHTAYQIRICTRRDAKLHYQQLAQEIKSEWS
eukprot:6629633-Pyramimonas_sp.AAC.1